MYIMNRTIILALLAACGAPAPLTWHEVAETWAQSWCAVDRRCDHDFASNFASDEACVQVVTIFNCAPRLHDCETIYDRPEELISSCLIAMETIGCTDNIPDSCFSAMR